MVEGNQTEKGITRRKFTFGVMIASMAGAFVSLFSLLKVITPPKKAGYVSTIKIGDQLVYAKGANAGSAVKASSMNVGDWVLAYPKGKTSNPANIVQLIKLKEPDFVAPTKLNLTDQGFVSYSAICTHLGCTVSWVKNTSNPEASVTECFCHNSIFDPAKGAKVIGGPAPIPLAQIGIKVQGDSVFFTSGFTGPIGPPV